jgi:cellulose synthase/poly-beta-1,6-N-acetylglucosamine synthase-like glycosyltransferase
LRACLEALGASTYREFEVVVVDDASTDGTADVAREFGATVLRMERQSGPAAARNRGAAAARGEYVLFVDADVCVAPETTGQFVDLFEHEPDVAAAFGSYDTKPLAGNILSQYRNLVHHHVHQEANRAASTFWAGCGAVRRTVFADMNGFDAGYGRPCIEDIEFGVRLSAAGHRIVLDKRIQVTHRKRWTLWNMVKTDVVDRAVPWTQLILRQGSVPNDLNLKVSQRISAVLTLGLLVVLGVGVWQLHALSVLPVAVLLAILGLDRWSRNRRIPTAARVAGVMAALAGAAALTMHFGPWMLLPLALAVGIVFLNLRLFLFFSRERQWLFAVLVFPLQLLYYLYSSAAFAWCVALHFVRKRGATAARDDRA